MTYKIGLNEFLGMIRDDTCFYDHTLPGWFCEKSQNLTTFMMNFQMLDKDYMVRRLTPLAVRSDTGYIDLINGPADWSDCFGYACMIRLNTYWSVMACEHHFDYYFTSTIPQRMNFHLPDYVKEQLDFFS